MERKKFLIISILTIFICCKTDEEINNQPFVQKGRIDFNSVFQSMNEAVKSDNRIVYDSIIEEMRMGQFSDRLIQYAYKMMLYNDYNKAYYDLVDLDPFKYNTKIDRGIENHYLFLLSISKEKGYKWKSILIGKKLVWYHDVQQPCYYMKDYCKAKPN